MKSGNKNIAIVVAIIMFVFGGCVFTGIIGGTIYFLSVRSTSDNVSQVTNVNNEIEEASPTSPASLSLPDATATPIAESATTSSVSPIVSVGEWLEANQVKVIVLNVQRIDEIYGKKATVLFDDQSYQFVVADVLYQNIGTEKQPACNYELYDTNGKAYDHGEIFKPSLNYEDMIYPGDIARENTTFIIPKTFQGELTLACRIGLNSNPLRFKFDPDAPVPDTRVVPQLPPSPGNINNPVEASMLRVTVLNAYKSDVTPDGLFGSEKPSTPDSEFLAVEVMIENISDQNERGYMPYQFYLTDRDGYRHKPPLHGFFTPKLEKRNILVGEAVRGYIAFEVTKSATGFRLSYQPSIVSNEPIHIDLGF